jgi:hypothetical protein
MRVGGGGMNQGENPRQDDGGERVFAVLALLDWEIEGSGNGPSQPSPPDS